MFIGYKFLCYNDYFRVGVAFMNYTLSNSACGFLLGCLRKWDTVKNGSCKLCFSNIQENIWMVDLCLSDFFLHLVLIFMRKLQDWNLPKCLLWCYTYGWSYGCCLVAQDVSGDILAVEEVTETKKRVQFIQYRWRDIELLGFYGVHTPATAAEFYLRGFAVFGISCMGQFACFKNGAALLTAIHLKTTVTDELFSILSQQKSYAFCVVSFHYQVFLKIPPALLSSILPIILKW